jgi:hypothetical protein
MVESVRDYGFLRDYGPLTNGGMPPRALWDPRPFLSFLLPGHEVRVHMMYYCHVLPHPRPKLKEPPKQ